MLSILDLKHFDFSQTQSSYVCPPYLGICSVYRPSFKVQKKVHEHMTVAFVRTLLLLKVQIAGFNKPQEVDTVICVFFQSSYKSSLGFFKKDITRFCSNVNL